MKFFFYIRWFFVLFVIFGLLWNQPPIGINLDLVNYPAFKSFHHVFGCDRLGRDVFSLFAYGILSTLLIAIPARLATILFSGLISMLVYTTGKISEYFINQLSYVFLSLPSLLIALLILSGLGANFITLPISILLADWANAYETIQSRVKEINQSGYVVASYSMGASKLHVFQFHLLPGILSLLGYLFLTGVPNVIMAIALFSFLGVDWSGDYLGPGLGEQIAFSVNYFDKSPLAVIMPVFGIVFMIVGLGKK
jgi:peptide/nickel transport system permease protein